MSCWRRAWRGKGQGRGVRSLRTFVPVNTSTDMTKDQSLRREGEHLLDEIKNLGKELLEESNEPRLLPPIHPEVRRYSADG